MTDDEVRLLRTGGVGVSAIERLADEALRRGRVIVEAQALHRQAVVDRARLEIALRGFIGFVEGGYGVSLKNEATLWVLARAGTAALSKP